MAKKGKPGPPKGSTNAPNPATTVNKGGNPAWKKGVSGNPGGRPKELAKFREACRTRSWMALKQIVDLVEGAEDEKVRLAAAKEILDRAWGKSAPSMDQSSSEQPNFTVKVVSASTTKTAEELTIDMVDPSKSSDN